MKKWRGLEDLHLIPDRGNRSLSRRRRHAGPVETPQERVSAITVAAHAAGVGRNALSVVSRLKCPSAQGAATSSTRGPAPTALRAVPSTNVDVVRHAALPMPNGARTRPEAVVPRPLIAPQPQKEPAKAALARTFSRIFGIDMIASFHRRCAIATATTRFSGFGGRAQGARLALG